MPSTIKTEWEALVAVVDNVVGVSGNGSTVVVRAFVEGEISEAERPIPFVAMNILDIREIGRSDDNRVYRVRFKITIWARIEAANDPHAEILAKIAQVNDVLDDFPGTANRFGVVRETWSISPAPTPTHGENASANMVGAFSVIVDRD